MGNSSSNPNYTRIVDKYSISNCSVDNNNNEKNIDLFIIDDDNSDNNGCIEINLICNDNEISNQIVKSINEEIKLSRQREKLNLKEFFYIN